MKTETFLLAAATGIFFILPSCQGDDRNTPAQTPAKLSVVATSLTTRAETGNELLFTGDDIKSFHSESRELVLFEELSFDALWSNPDPYTLTFYLDDRKLFESGAVAMSVDTFINLSGRVYNDLIFVAHSPQRSEKLFLLDGYPPLERLEPGREEARQIREANIRKRQTEWDLFIHYLSDAGKLLP
jgi:hypothetical protein